MNDQRKLPQSPAKLSAVWLILQFLGELVLTVGIVAMLYVGWQFFYTDYTANREHAQVVKDIAKDFHAPPVPAETPAGKDPNDMASFGDPIVGKKPDLYKKFGIIYLPRFGPDFSRPLVEGVDPQRVLDTFGIGHYESSQMPGEVGNFAIAGHRNTNGSVLDLIGELQPGDHIYIQTQQGFYQYTYRNSMYVPPHRSDVIAPVPTMPQATPTERFMTLTSCHPRYTDHQRVIAYATYTGWRPLSAGPPAEISAVVAKNQAS